MTKDVGEKIDESVLLWFGHMERMENAKIAKRVYVGSRSVGMLQKRCIDTVKDRLKKRDLDVRQARRMMHNKRIWRVLLGGVNEVLPGDEPLTLTRCYSCETPQPYEALERRKSVCGQAHNLRA